MVHKFAFENPHLKAEAVSAVVMTDLAQQYKVMSTPHLVLNGTRAVKGRLSEETLLAAILVEAG
ncbi:MAG: hypothetical protein HC875_23825 [Anaerolineales bacterium]|nr:hypothetical protein [Anaerolineales bacterium]